MWKPGWTELLANKDVVFCYDSDNAGQVGFEKVCVKHLAGAPTQPKSVSFIDWSKDADGVPDGYDLNDAYRNHKENTFNYLSELITPFESTSSTVAVNTTIETIEANRRLILLTSSWTCLGRTTTSPPTWNCSCFFYVVAPTQSLSRVNRCGFEVLVQLVLVKHQASKP